MGEQKRKEAAIMSEVVGYFKLYFLFTFFFVVFIHSLLSFILVSLNPSKICKNKQCRRPMGEYVHIQL